MITRPLLMTALLLALAPPLAAQQAWPARPIRAVLPFAPGGSTDTMMRILAPRLGEALGQTIVIDNRGGGGGNIAAEIVARALPDGYTIFVGSAMLTTNKALYGKLTYDPERDFAPITHLATGPYLVVVHPAVPAKTVGDLIAVAKAKPGAISYGSSGIGGASHLAGELLKRQAGMDVVHVSYKGGGPAALAVIGGEISYMFGSIAASLGHVNGGRLRAIAVSGLKRAPQAPDVPTIDESGVRGFNVTTWDSLVAPAATPRAVIDRLHGETVKALHTPEVREALRKMGYEPTGTSPEELGRFLREETALWSKVIREAKIRIE
jgi:tripartite-type tricarboxylate transporter receptor subunit TctC